MADLLLHFATEDIEFTPPFPEHIFGQWIAKVAEEEGQRIEEISYIFCSDHYLLQLNREYLEHDEYTDILTFDYSDQNGINGDIFISLERVADNAERFGFSQGEELLRIMIHGVLHLAGYRDKDKEDRLLMRKKEDHYIALIADELPENYTLGRN